MASYNNFPNINVVGDLQANSVSGAAGEVLTSDGLGGMSWSAPASGGGEFTAYTPLGAGNLPAAGSNILNLANFSSNSANFTYVAGTGVWTCAKSGFYKISFSLSGQITNNTTTFYIQPNKNGAAFYTSRSNRVGTASDFTNWSFEVANNFSVGNTFTLVCGRAGVGDFSYLVENMMVIITLIAPI